MEPTPGGPSPAAGAAPLSLQPGSPEQPVVVGGLPVLFLAPPPADMLPPAGLPELGLGALTRAPSPAPASPAGVPAFFRAPLRPPPRPRLPHRKSRKLPPPAPALRGAAGPAAGAGTGEAGLAHRPGKSVREKSRPGVGEARRAGVPGTPGGSREGHRP